MSYLELKGVSKGFPRAGKRRAPGADRVAILSGIDLSIEENEFVCIVGRSGAGKTTLISLIAGC